MLGLQGRAQARCLHLYGARPGGRELPRQFFLFMCRELLPTLLTNWTMMMRGEDEPGKVQHASVEHPATGLVFVLRLGPVRPCWGHTAAPSLGLAKELGPTPTF